MSPTTVLSIVTDGAPIIGANLIYILAGIAGILAVFPTSHDGGTVTGRIFNIVNSISNGIVTILKLFGKPAPVVLPVDAPATPPVEPVAPVPPAQ